MRLGIGEAAVGGGRDARFGAELLGEGLGPFETRRLLLGAEGLDAGVGKIVDEAGHQRCFRSDHHEIHAFSLAKGDDGRMVGGVDSYDVGDLGNSRVTGRAAQTVELRGRAKGRGNGVFTPARTDKEYVHLGPPTSPSRCRAPYHGGPWNKRPEGDTAGVFLE